MTDPSRPDRSGPPGSGVDDQATVYDLAELIADRTPEEIYGPGSSGTDPEVPARLEYAAWTDLPWRTPATGHPGVPAGWPDRAVPAPRHPARPTDEHRVRAQPSAPAGARAVAGRAARNGPSAGGVRRHRRGAPPSRRGGRAADGADGDRCCTVPDGGFTHSDAHRLVHTDPDPPATVRRLHPAGCRDLLRRGAGVLGLDPQLCRFAQAGRAHPL